MISSKAASFLVLFAGLNMSACTVPSGTPEAKNPSAVNNPYQARLAQSYSYPYCQYYRPSRCGKPVPQITTPSPLAGVTQEQRAALQNASPQERAQAFRDLKRDLRRQQRPEFAGVRVGETLSDALATLRPHGQPRLEMRCGQAVSGNTYIKTCSVVDANSEAALRQMEMRGKFVGAAGLRFLGADAIGLNWKDESGNEYTIALTPSEVGEEPLQQAISDATITRIIGMMRVAVFCRRSR
jgi:hypothetical protein